jgi:hypothetical protein
MTTTTDLQTLLDDRLGEHGPWHEATRRLRAKGYGWESVAGRIRTLAGLDVDRLRGETLRRWMTRRLADELAAAKAAELHAEHVERRAQAVA